MIINQLTVFLILMSFGERLAQSRKEKNLSQEELANILGTKAPVIGRYERGLAKPSVEVAAKIAEILDVSLDYLTGSTDLMLEKGLLDRVVEIQKLGEVDQKHLLILVDAFLRDAKARKAYA